VVGALLVTVAAVGSFALATGGDHAPSTSFAVASHDLAPGDVVGADDLALVPVDLPAAQAATAFPSVVGLDGAVVRGPVSRGAILTRATLEQAPSSGLEVTRYREVSFAVPGARALDGAIAAGDVVDVLSSTDLDTLVLAERATVIAVSENDDGALVDGRDVVLTLALPDAAVAVAVAHGGARGELSVLRSTRAEDHLPVRYRPGAATTAAGPTTTTSSAPGTGA
jgi:hypothetical protein